MTSPWWRGAIFYQVYVRSLADSTDDGIGDPTTPRTSIPGSRPPSTLPANSAAWIDSNLGS